MKLASEYVQIELKNGTVVAGTVVSVTPDMNTVLNDVKMTMKGEEPVTVDTITLRGSTIRYFVLPESLQLDNMISDTSRKPRIHQPPAVKQGRGGFRGQRGGVSRGGFRGGANSIRGRGNPRGRGRGGFRGGMRGGSRGGGSGSSHV